MNDPKYHTGPIINTASGEVIPQDEPVFIFRARDVEALKVLEFYWELISERHGGQEHADAIRARIEEFYAFKENNPHRMKIPDTDLDNQGLFAFKSEETSERVGGIAARVLSMRGSESPDALGARYDELLDLAKTLAGSALTQRPDRS